MAVRFLISHSYVPEFIIGQHPIICHWLTIQYHLPVIAFCFLCGVCLTFVHSCVILLLQLVLIVQHSVAQDIFLYGKTVQHPSFIRFVNFISISIMYI